MYSIHVVVDFYPGTPFVLPSILLVCLLYLMHIYWFIYIMRLVFKLITGQELNDNREDEEDEGADRIDKEE